MDMLNSCPANPVLAVPHKNNNLFQPKPIGREPEPKTYGFGTWIIKYVHQQYAVQIDEIWYLVQDLVPGSDASQKLLYKAIEIRNRFPRELDTILNMELATRLNKSLRRSKGYLTKKIDPTPREYETFTGKYLFLINSWNPEEYRGAEGSQIFETTFCEEDIVKTSEYYNSTAFPTQEE
jgi:hypothetical protein